MRKPRVYWRWFKWQLTKDGWEPTDTGWLLTLSLFTLILKIGLLKDEGIAKFDQFVSLRPSEMGDTIAGLFSALAFIWIIVTVFIQSRELRETRVEVKQQRVASEKMAEAMSVQSSIFEDEQREREMASRAKLVEELVASLRWRVERTSLQWIGERDAYGHGVIFSGCPPVPPEGSNFTDEKFFQELLTMIENISFDLYRFEQHRPISQYPRHRDLRLIHEDIKVLWGNIDQLTVTEKTRFDRLQIGELDFAIETLLSSESMWSA